MMRRSESPRPAEHFHLPAGYAQRASNQTLDANRGDSGEYWSPWRIAESGKWQHHVYLWAARMAVDRRAASVLDVGCGVCTKLVKHIAPLCGDVTGMDQPAALAAARALGVRLALDPIDLERPPESLGRTFDLIICADVVEHLLDPDPMLRMIRSGMHARSVAVFSTPERDRERGRACMSSDKPEHVREWSRPEFRAFLESRGFIVLRSRLLPKDDTPRNTLTAQEALFRAGRADRSPLCCQAWACRLA